MKRRSKLELNKLEKGLFKITYHHSLKRLRKSTTKKMTSIKDNVSDEMRRQQQ